MTSNVFTFLQRIANSRRGVCFQILAYLIGVLLSYFLVKSFNIAAPGPDALLWEGIALNIYSGLGAVDTIRNDYIIPSVGHPLLIILAKFLGINEFDFIFYEIFISYLILFHLVYSQTGRLFFGIICLPIFHYFIPDVFIANNIEGSLLLTSMGTLWATLKFFSDDKDRIALAAAICFSASLLVRPFFLPMLYLFATFWLFYMILSGFGLKLGLEDAFKRKFSVFLLATSAIVAACGSYSYIKYRDARLVSGTYGAFVIYGAFNEYIPLKAVYSSHYWKKLPPAVREEAIEPMQLRSTWQARHDLLMAKSASFILNNPGLALEGYFWRMKQYTHSPLFPPQKYLFWFCFLTCSILNALIVYNKTVCRGFRKLVLCSWLFGFYILFFASVFTFVGPRYLISATAYFYFPFIILLILISKIWQNQESSTDFIPKKIID